MKKVVAAIQQGDSVIVENCPEDIDAALNPVLQVKANVTSPDSLQCVSSVHVSSCAWLPRRIPPALNNVK